MAVNELAGHERTVSIQAGSRLFHVCYNSAKAVTDAIDALVEKLTGDRGRFWSKPDRHPPRATDITFPPDL